jgi:ketosteroid isomerase-like protein
LEALAAWQDAWDCHDLDGVMELFHEDILFENWSKKN